jgi:hypothetical protein
MESERRPMHRPDQGSSWDSSCAGAVPQRLHTNTTVLFGCYVLSARQWVNALQWADALQQQQQQQICDHERRTAEADVRCIVASYCSMMYCCC